MSSPAPAVPTERAWEQLWLQLTLRQGFWLGFVFESDQRVVAELEERVGRFLRGQARGVEAFHVARPVELREAALAWLLADHPPSAGLVWLAGTGTGADWIPAWEWFLRRLNEQRSALLAAVPNGLALVLPAGLLVLAREAAPDLWRYRGAVVEAAARPPGFAREVPHREPPPDPGGGPGRLLVADDDRLVAPAIEPSATLRPTLARVAAEIQAGRGAPAAALAATAVESASSGDDQVLARAWLARALDRKGDGTAAARQALAALDGQRPLGPAATTALLGIVARSEAPGVARAAAERLVDLQRLEVDHSDATPESLRDLSLLLNNVGRRAEADGDADAARSAYQESLELARRIDQRWGPTPESLRDLSVSLDNVGRRAEADGDADAARSAYQERQDVEARLAALAVPAPETPEFNGG